MCLDVLYTFWRLNHLFLFDLFFHLIHCFSFVRQAADQIFSYTNVKIQCYFFQTDVAENFVTTVDNIANVNSSVLAEAQTYSNAASRYFNHINVYPEYKCQRVGTFCKASYSAENYEMLNLVYIFQ